MNINGLRILVTAVGGDLGQAVVKALRLSKNKYEIFGCDISPKSIGKMFVDSYHVVPFASDTGNYLHKLNSLCQSLKIQAVIPSSEPEIAVLSRLSSPPKLDSGTAIICSEAEWINKFGDKLNCMRALDGIIELVPFADGSDREAVNLLLDRTGFPVVVKSRFSSGSRTIQIAHTQRQLDFYLAGTFSPLVQDYIDDNEGEFSAGVFNCHSFSTAIAFKRKLGFGGSSSVAETSDDKDIIDYVTRISNAINMQGSANIQVRKSSKGVRLLEINPRFSSLAAARALCGFLDVEWSLKLILGIKLNPPHTPYRHICFNRFLHEVVDFGDGFHTIRKWCPK